MKFSVQIPSREIEKAAEAMKEREGICDIIPRAEFVLRDDSSDFVFNTLICSPADMQGRATGIAGSYCLNCLKKRDYVAYDKALNKV